MADYFAYDNGLPCRNPACRSHGRPHPNCKCYGAAEHGSQEGTGTTAFAKGGPVCQGPHQPGCEYYLAGGGALVEPPKHAHPSITLGHAAVHHGLTGMLKDVGNSNLVAPEKHRRHMEKVRGHLSTGNMDKAIDSLQDHPLAGRAPRAKLEPIVHRLAPEMVSKEMDPDSFRASADYLHSAIKGHDALTKHMSNFFDKQTNSEKVKADPERRKNLDDFMKNSQEKPEDLLEVGGSLGHYLPDHAAALGQLSAQAVNYLNSIRPKPVQLNPLDEPVPPTETAMEEFDRQLDIAENPMLVLQHARAGELLPDDVKTVRLLYPALYQSMLSKATDALVAAKSGGKEIPYHQSVSIGLLFGQPLESSMTPMGLQSIMRANGSQETQEQQQMAKQKKSQSRPTGAQLKVIEKTDNLYETPIEKRQINQK